MYNNISRIINNGRRSALGSTEKKNTENHACGTDATVCRGTLSP